MAGKVLGIGLMGLAQVVVIVAATGISAYASGITDFLFNSGVDLTSAIIWAVVWFIVGYFSFACLFAAVGSMVAKPEEVQNAVGPLVIIIMLGYFSAIYLTVGVPSLGGGFSMLAEIIKFIPLVNVLAMSSGLAAGTVSNVDGFIALGISLVFIPLLIWLGGKIYSYSILQTGSKVKLLKVFGRTRWSDPTTL
jgi:ABC-2 type transport system permease protein